MYCMCNMFISILFFLAFFVCVYVIIRMSKLKRIERFIDYTTITSNSSRESLEIFSELFARTRIPYVFNSDDLYEALLTTGVDADFVIREAERMVEFAEQIGAVTKHRLYRCEAMCIATIAMEVPKERGKSPYKVINEALSGEIYDDKCLVKVRRLIILILRSLAKLPKVTKNVVYRGLSLEDKNKILELSSTGVEMMFKGFTSVSTNRKMMRRTFSSEEDENKTFLLEIEGPVSGYKIKEFSPCPSEREIILVPETLLEIIITPTVIGEVQIKCKIKSAETVFQEQSSVDREVRRFY